MTIFQYNLDRLIENYFRAGGECLVNPRRLTIEIEGVEMGYSEAIRLMRKKVEQEKK